MTLQQAVRARLMRDFRRVPPAQVTTRGVHLEVWEHAATGRAIGVEFNESGKARGVGFWIKTQYLAGKVLPEGIARREKWPKGRDWTDAEGKGANSNLKAYMQFSGAKITHLLAGDEGQAMAALDMAG